MKKSFALLLAPLFLILTACSSNGEKTSSLTIVYGVAMAFSLLLLVGYTSFVKKKELWFVLLFAAILVVNIGYFALSLSRNLEEALWANRIAYLGSVFLPMSMMMNILRVLHIRYPKWLPIFLLVLAIVIFLVAASPGYLTIYYKEVTHKIVNGVSVLQKVYGSWHKLYLFYLLGYFSAMVGLLLYACLRQKIETVFSAVMLVVAVFVNIGVWLLEQFVEINFEILSVSYIISGLFLLGLKVIIRENEKLKSLLLQNTMLAQQVAESSAPKVQEETQPMDEAVIEAFQMGLKNLTRTELIIYSLYLEGKSTKEIMSELNIKENTLKFHNKNLYGKLGVSSRKQLCEIARALTKS